MLNGLPWKWTEIFLSLLRLHPTTAFKTHLGLTSLHKEGGRLCGCYYCWESPGPLFTETWLLYDVVLVLLAQGPGVPALSPTRSCFPLPQPGTPQGCRLDLVVQLCPLLFCEGRWKERLYHLEGNAGLSAAQVRVRLEQLCQGSSYPVVATRSRKQTHSERQCR